jgi:hypothetical protein
LLQVAKEAALDVAALLAPLGLTEAQLLDPSTRLSPEQGQARDAYETITKSR